MGLLRLLLALSVVSNHYAAGEYLLPADIAVQGFFIISGFYMSLVLDTTYRDASPWTFWRARYLRLAPAWLAMVALALLIFAFAPKTPLSFQYGEHFRGLPLAQEAFVAIANLTMLGADWLSFMYDVPGIGALAFSSTPFQELGGPGLGFLLLPQGWSLGVEMSFYLVAPFVLRRGWTAVLALFAGSVAVRGAMALAGLDHDPFTYRFFPVELATFLLGYFAYRSYRILDGGLGPAIIGALALAGILAAAWVLGAQTVKAPFLIVLAIALPFVFTLTKDMKADRLIGDLSYPLYLAHWPPLALGLHRGAGFATAVALSIVLVLFIERPMERYRHRAVARVGAEGDQTIATGCAGQSADCPAASAAAVRLSR